MPVASLMCLGVGFSIGALSHIVKSEASPDFHNLSITVEAAPSHNVKVRNGGANHLKAWRDRAELSQEQLAERVGTTASMISMLETEARGLSAKWLRRLAVALGTTPGFLLDHDPSELPRDLLEIWLKADERQKRQITDIAKTIVLTGTDR